MCSRIETMTSTNDYWGQIKAFKQQLEMADAVLIGAGAGMSVSAGFEYNGKRFDKYFSDFAKKYGFQDMYFGGFYPYQTLEEYWAYWSRYIYINRYNQPAGQPYIDLLELVKEKDYFVLTTNVDHRFQVAGFNKQRLFYTQGDYGLFQCSTPCCEETYDNEELVVRMVQEQRNMKIPSALVPYCKHCGKPLSMNLRSDHTFVEDEGWKEASKRYAKFIRNHKCGKVLYLELGVGYNTPSIIKYPFWQMADENPQSTYVCINADEPDCVKEIAERSICIQGDIGNILKDVR